METEKHRAECAANQVPEIFRNPALRILSSTPDTHLLRALGDYSSYI